MRLLEYQGKSILRQAEIPVPKSALVYSGEDFHEAVCRLRGPLVVKAQVPVSGRQMAGGILVATDVADAQQLAAQLVHREVGGFDVEVVLIEEQLAIEREYFVAITYDDRIRQPVALLSAAGGAGVEARVGQLERRAFSAWHGLPPYLAREMGVAVGARGRELVALSQLIARLARLFLDNDMLLMEINPLAVTEAAQLVALDCRIELDDDALFRHRDNIAEVGAGKQPGSPQSDIEQRAAEIDATDHRGAAGRLIAFDGDLGLLIGGGGASLTIFDVVLDGGGQPANFCEIGGNPSVWKVAELTKFVLSKAGVKHLAVIMNVVSNTRVDLIARGVIKGILELGEIPHERIIAFRVPGSWQAEGKKILSLYDVPYFDHRTSIDQVVEYILTSRGVIGHPG